ncbi:MAG TPA: GntR family transcriptional regulator [Casimicrobiaceae bacterium]|nr:GntR family transcriptional regulator [Casimicrobiaceae bacterium]
MAMHAYAAIKKRILDFRYAPGERLSEAQLAKELGLGRSPIRTALVKLKSDGWIAINPQSGTYIKSLSDREIADLVDLRLLLETHATKLAAKAIGEDDLRTLRRALVSFCPRGVAQLSERAFDDFNELDSIVHLTIYRAAGNALIADILANLLDKVQWLKSTTRPSATRIRSGFSELKRIVNALEAHDAEEAASRMREHIANAADFSAQTRRRPRRDAGRGNGARRA